MFLQHRRLSYSRHAVDDRDLSTQVSTCPPKTPATRFCQLHICLKKILTQMLLSCRSITRCKWTSGGCLMIENITNAANVVPATRWAPSFILYSKNSILMDTATIHRRPRRTLSRIMSRSMTFNRTAPLSNSPMVRNRVQTIHEKNLTEKDILTINDAKISNKFLYNRTAYCSSRKNVRKVYLESVRRVNDHKVLIIFFKFLIVQWSDCAVYFSCDS